MKIKGIVGYNPETGSVIINSDMTTEELLVLLDCITNELRAGQDRQSIGKILNINP